MLIVSEQQTFAKLRLAPADFIKLLDEDPEKAEAYIVALQGEREKDPRAKKPPKDPSQPKKSKQPKSLNLAEME